MTPYQAELVMQEEKKIVSCHDENDGVNLKTSTASKQTNKKIAKTMH